MQEKLEIYYIRHADTDCQNSEDRDSCDVKLSGLGEQQLVLLAQRFEGRSFDAVFASPLVRCVQTAAAVCNGLAKKTVLEICPLLVENGTTHGYFGMDEKYLSRYYENTVINRDLPLVYENTTDEANDKRAKLMLEYIKRRFSYGDRVLVVSHGSFGNHFLPMSVGLNMNDAIFSVSNTSVSKVKYTSDGKKRISFLNDISHLRSIEPDYEFTV